LASCALVLAAAVLCSACFQFSTVLTLKADGSGTATASPSSDARNNDKLVAALARIEAADFIHRHRAKRFFYLLLGKQRCRYPAG
jgi:hypothetical protein